MAKIDPVQLIAEASYRYEVMFQKCCKIIDEGCNRKPQLARINVARELYRYYCQKLMIKEQQRKLRKRVKAAAAGR